MTLININGLVIKIKTFYRPILLNVTFYPLKLKIVSIEKKRN